MKKVATNEPPREECACGEKVIRARGERGTVFLVEIAGRIGTWSLELDLMGGVPTATRVGRGTRFKLHNCKLLEVGA